MPKPEKTNFEVMERYFLALHLAFGLKYVPYNPEILKEDWIKQQEEKLFIQKEKQIKKLMEFLEK